MKSYDFMDRAIGLFFLITGGAMFLLALCALVIVLKA